MAEAEAAHAAHDILQVLAECHRKGICYADVKPANFLLTRPYRRSGKGDDSRLLELRTTDFGCSQRIQEVRVCHCGTAANCTCADVSCLGLHAWQEMQEVLTFVLPRRVGSSISEQELRSTWHQNCSCAIMV